MFLLFPIFMVVTTVFSIFDDGDGRSLLATIGLYLLAFFGIALIGIFILARYGVYVAVFEFLKEVFGGIFGTIRDGLKVAA